MPLTRFCSNAPHPRQLAMWPYIQDCIAAYPNATDVPTDSWATLNSNVHTLIGISGYQRARIQEQYARYKREARGWRSRLAAAVAANHAREAEQGSAEGGDGSGGASGGPAQRWSSLLLRALPSGEAGAQGTVLPCCAMQNLVSDATYASDGAAPVAVCAVACCSSNDIASVAVRAVAC